MKGRKLKNSMVFTVGIEEILDAPFYVNDDGKILSWRDYKIGDAIRAFVIAQLREKHPQLYEKVGGVTIRVKGDKYIITARNKSDVKDKGSKLPRDPQKN